MPKGKTNATSGIPETPFSRPSSIPRTPNPIPKFISLEYSTVQSIRISSNPEAINAVNKYHLYLREYCKFSCAEITEMACADDGLRKITAVYLYYEVLKEIGLSNHDIVAEVLKPEGHHQLFAVITARVLNVQKSQDILKGIPVSLHERKKITDVLFKAWFDRENSVRRFFSGSEPLEQEALPPEEAPAPEEELDLVPLPERSLYELKNDVAQLGFTPIQVSGINQPRTGSRNLWAVITYYELLTNTYYFTHDQIIRMVSHRGGSRNLWAVITYYELLTNTYYFTHDQIIQMVSHRGGSQTVEAVLTHHERLTGDFKFDNDEILRMVSHCGGSANLDAVIDHYEQLGILGFTNEQIVKTVSRHGGRVLLDAICDHYGDLMSSGFRFEELLGIVSSPTANAGAIKLLHANFNGLDAAGKTKAEIIKLVSTPQGRTRIKEMVKSREWVGNMVDNLRASVPASNVLDVDAGASSYDQPDAPAGSSFISMPT